MQYYAIKAGTEVRLERVTVVLDRPLLIAINEIHADLSRVAALYGCPPDAVSVVSEGEFAILLRERDLADRDPIREGG